MDDSTIGSRLIRTTILYDAMVTCLSITREADVVVVFIIVFYQSSACI